MLPSSHHLKKKEWAATLSSRDWLNGWRWIPMLISPMKGNVNSATNGMPAAIAPIVIRSSVMIAKGVTRSRSTHWPTNSSPWTNMIQGWRWWPAPCMIRPNWIVIAIHVMKPPVNNACNENTNAMILSFLMLPHPWSKLIWPIQPKRLFFYHHFNENENEKKWNKEWTNQ